MRGSAWLEGTHYDLVLNTRHFSVEAAAAVVTGALFTGAER